MLNIFVSCIDILVSKVFRVKPTFCEHFLIVPRCKEIVNTTLDWFGLVSQSVLLLTPAVCSLLFQLPILLPEKFPARSSKPVFLSALSFQRLKALSACFPPVCQLFFEQAGELGVKLRHVLHEIDWSVLFLLMFQIWYLRK